MDGLQARLDRAITEARKLHQNQYTLAISDPLERFWSHVTRTPTCWLWNGGGVKRNYPRFCTDGRQFIASRWIYERLIGPIPDGYQIDHVRARGCTSNQCVNPAHLEAVSPRENTMRGDAITAQEARQDACKRGHPYTAETLHISPDGRRQCRACWKLRVKTPAQRERERLRSKRRREAERLLGEDA